MGHLAWGKRSAATRRLEFARAIFPKIAASRKLAESRAKKARGPFLNRPVRYGDGNDGVGNWDMSQFRACAGRAEKPAGLFGAGPIGAQTKTPHTVGRVCGVRLSQGNPTPRSAGPFPCG